MCAQLLSRVQLYATSQTVASQASLYMGFSQQKYLSGLTFSSPGNLLDPGIGAVSPKCPALAGKFFTTQPPGNPTKISLTLAIKNYYCKVISLQLIKINEKNLFKKKLLNYNNQDRTVLGKGQRDQ